MALGAVTVLPASLGGRVYGLLADGLKVTVNNVVPTSGANYPTGGQPITPQQLGFSDAVIWGVATAITQAATVGPGETAVIVQADGSIKLKCGLAAGTGENASNADLSGTLVQIVAIGY